MNIKKTIYFKKKNRGFDYDRAKSFFHCKHCMDGFLGSELHKVMTPRDYGSYEASTYDIETNTGKKECVVVWCKRCGRGVWNSNGI